MADEEEYEYEYVELAEGEELPEGVEYEYEYVEVPADEAVAEQVVEPLAAPIAESSPEPRLIEPVVEEAPKEVFLEPVVEEAPKDVFFDPVAEVVDDDNVSVGSFVWKPKEVAVEPVPVAEEIAPVAAEGDSAVLNADDMHIMGIDNFIGEDASIDDMLNNILDDETPLDFDENVTEVTPEPVAEPTVEPIAEPVVSTPAAEPVDEPVVDDFVDIFEEEAEPVVETPEPTPATTVVHSVLEPFVNPAPVVAAPEPVLESEPEPEVINNTVVEEVVAEQVAEEKVEIDLPFAYEVADLDERLLVSAGTFFRSGLIDFYSAENNNGILVLKVENAAELVDWNFVVFDKKIVPIEHEVKEFTLPRSQNVARYTRVVKEGEDKLELFNQDTLRFMIPTEDFAKVKGHFIYGNVNQNAGLIVDDMITISLKGKLEKMMTFGRPVSGMFAGPRGTIVYVADLRCLLIRTIS